MTPEEKRKIIRDHIQMDHMAIAEKMSVILLSIDGSSGIQKQKNEEYYTALTDALVFSYSADRILKTCDFSKLTVN